MRNVRRAPNRAYQYAVHAARRKETPSSMRCDAEKETSVHILCECLVLENVRMQTLGIARMDPDPR